MVITPDGLSGREEDPVADPGFPMGGVDPLWGGMDPQHGCFSVKMYVKMKELGPVGGVRPARPPRSANEILPHRKISMYFYTVIVSG